MWVWENKHPYHTWLGGCSPWGRWGSDTTERLHFHFSLSCIGEGNGNPLQCSCQVWGAPGGLPSMGSHRVKHDWSDLAAAAVTKLCLTLCDLMDCSTPDFPVLSHFMEFAQIHVHWVSDAIQPSHLLSSSSPPAFSLSQHQGLFQWVDSLHQVAKVLESYNLSPLEIGRTWVAWDMIF